MSWNADVMECGCHGLRLSWDANLERVRLKDGSVCMTTAPVHSDLFYLFIYFSPTVCIIFDVRHRVMKKINITKNSMKIMKTRI